MKKVLLMAVLLLAAMPGWCDGHCPNYDYSTTVSTGQTLYFKCDYHNYVATIVAPDVACGSGWTAVDATWYGYAKPTGDLIIPQQIAVDGWYYLNVTGIDNNAFIDCESLTSVTFSNVSNIGNLAFAGCSALSSVNFTENVTTSIGSDAFNSCGLTSVTIPASVTSIGSGAFANCPNLASITVANNNTVYDSRNNCNAIIETSSNTLVVGCKNTIIPNTISTIGVCAFWYCTELPSITIANSVTSIEQGAFGHCTGLTSIAIPNSVNSIGAQAFRYCTSLNSITMGSGVSTISYGAFANCSNLQTITIPESVTIIGNWAFYGCDSLTSVTFNADSCFYAGVFYGTNNPHAFYGCNNITNFTFGNNVKIIPANLCRGLSGITSIEIPNSVISINDSAFYGCSHLASVTLGANIANISKFVFGNCTNLTSIIIPNSTTYMGNGIFNNCTALSSAVIGNGMTTVPSNTFNGCNHLTNITIGSGVQTIATDAFNGCNAVLQMTVRAAAPPTSTSNPFAEFNTGIPVHVPCNSIAAYQNAPYWGFFTNYQGQFYSFSATSADPSMGYVQVITEPDCANHQAEIKANAYNDYHFVRWSDGNTNAHRYIVVTQDTAIQAQFASDNVGINDIDDSGFEVYTESGRICVKADGQQIIDFAVYDMVGREITNGAQSILPNGVYLVKVATLPARKVVVVR